MWYFGRRRRREGLSDFSVVVGLGEAWLKNGR